MDGMFLKVRKNPALDVVQEIDAYGSSRQAFGHRIVAIRQNRPQGALLFTSR
jgi:hypothetical protein